MEFLRRYTDIVSAMDILQNRRLTLVGQSNWIDKNDTAAIDAYKKRTASGSVLTLCLTECIETSHHWLAFANGPNGVCISFDKNRLIQKISCHADVRSGAMKYPPMGEMRTATNIRTEEIPFTKRLGYRDEKEFRIIYKSPEERLSAWHLPIDIATIDRIILSPALHPNLRDAVVKTLQSIKGCSGLKVVRSTLHENNEWKNRLVGKLPT